jgi:hypothetical protein
MAVDDVSVVMVHGGWADGSSWARVITGLATQGVKASAAPLPLTSLAVCPCACPICSPPGGAGNQGSCPATP